MLLKLQDFGPPELKAISELKDLMSKRAEREVSIDEAVEEYLARYRAEWLREKLRADNLAQIDEINRHKWIESEKTGRDMGHAAAEAWCARYAHVWRQQREALERNGFLGIDVVVTLQHGVHMRPNSVLAEIARRFDADIYVHMDGMPYANFLLNGRAFMSVKSVVGILSLGIVHGSRLQVIATGTHAREALDAVAAAISPPRESSDASP